MPVTPNQKVTRLLAADPLLATLINKKSSGGRYRGKGVVVTGGASGIGRAIAIAFALEGARITILDFNRERGRETAKLLRDISSGSRFICVDLRDYAAVGRLKRLFAGKNGAEILVNNAAMGGRIAPVHTLKWEECDALLRVNLGGPFLLSQCAAAGMIKADRKGSIVNILTIQTALPVPGYSAYIAGKGGLDALTLAMAVDLAPHGIRVNGVRVGSVLTDNFLSVLPPELKRRVESEEGVAALDRRAATLLGRMGLPVEIARVVLFMASEEAGYLTGSIVRADGGRALSRKVEPLL